MKRTLLTAGIASAITAGAIAYTGNDSSQSPVDAAKPVIAKHTVDRTAIIDALSETPQLVGLTGNVAKTVTFDDDRWFGDKRYDLTVKGTFKLGVDTEDIRITTQGNTVVVRFPQPKLISVELPFDRAAIAKDVGLLRGELDEHELQALYGEARKAVVSEIKVNVKAREKADKAVEHAVEDVIEQVPHVERVIFVD